MNNSEMDYEKINALKELDKSVLMLDIFPTIKKEVIDLTNLRFKRKQFKDFEQAV
jgi:hypothetical protein